MTADVKTFKLKARGDHDSGKSELLTAFAHLARQFGMTVELVEKDHHLIVTSTKEQRERVWKANQKRAAHEARRT
jgi:molybdopterin-guanine dinucleotide biosynthesis protein